MEELTQITGKMGEVGVVQGVSIGIKLQKANRPRETSIIR